MKFGLGCCGLRELESLVEGEKYRTATRLLFVADDGGRKEWEQEAGRTGGSCTRQRASSHA